MSRFLNSVNHNIHVRVSNPADIGVSDATSQALLTSIDTDTTSLLTKTSDRRVGGYKTVSGTEIKAGWCEFDGGNRQTVGTGFDNQSLILTFDRTRLGVAVSIASTSATDNYDEATPANSTGAHTVRVSAVDSNGDEVSILQHMNGTTEQFITVDGTKGAAAASLIAINSLFVMALGLAVDPVIALNVGTISSGPSTGGGQTWIAGTPSPDAWGVVEAGGGFSAAILWYQPNGSQSVFDDATFSADPFGGNAIYYDVYRNNADVTSFFPGLQFGIDWHVLRVWAGASSTNVFLSSIRPMDPGDVFWITVDSAAGNGHHAAVSMNCTLYAL